MLKQLAGKTWNHPSGKRVSFSPETIRVWVRRFQRGGLNALDDAPRRKPGCKVLTQQQQDTICDLKRQVPSRSIQRIIDMMESMMDAPRGLLKPSTVHRVLQKNGLSKRKKGAASTYDLDRYEAKAPNDTWQSDMMMGPYLPDPERPGKSRRAWLHVFLDDHSRLLLAGRWGFKSDLPTLELVFRQALRTHGLPKRVYYDNGGPYRSNHMKQIVAQLSGTKPVYTTPYRPEGHGKVEAFNRYCRAAFVDEVPASSITTIDELNIAFNAWVELKYNRRKHGETGQTPWARWRQGADTITKVSEYTLANAFLFDATRTTDKSGILKLHGVKYQVSPDLARKKVRVRYDPERMEEIQIWRNNRLQERVKPKEVGPHRREKRTLSITENNHTTTHNTPGPDYLKHLVERHTPQPIVDAVAVALKERARRDNEVVDVLRIHLVEEVFHEQEIRLFLSQYGPFDKEQFTDALIECVVEAGADQHVAVLLESVRKRLLEAS